MAATLNSGAQMDDLTATRLCAEAMGLTLRENGDRLYVNTFTPYRPLHDDAQAMALVKRFRLRIGTYSDENPSDAGTTGWRVWFPFKVDLEIVDQDDLNRAIVYCVAKMQSARIREGTNPHSINEGK